MTPKQAELVESTAITPAEKPGDKLEMFERLASDPNASVDKIERLMALWERSEARLSETSFNASMSDAQEAMQPVRADALNPQTRSRYASYEALDRALRPIYTKHGFGLSFDTGDSPLGEHVRVLCYVTHRAGHARTYHADIPADGKGARGGDVMTKTHAVGSALSYGMRYLLKLIFNVAVEDDDGNQASGQKQAPTPPAGYQQWLDDLTAVADEGWARLEQAWKASKAECRNYAQTYAPDTIVKLKAKARSVK